MTDETNSIRDQLISDKKIRTEITRRLSPDVFESVPPQMVPEYLENGWIVDRRLKVKVKMRRPKSHDVAFEDRVWATMAKLNFTDLNRDRSFRVSYGFSQNESQQIDVFAADDEVVLLFECKSTSTQSKSAFKKDIEAIQGFRGGMIRTIKASYPKHKIKFVLATNNFGLSKETLERIEAAEIIHMDEDTIDYYSSLADHLGKAARYQLLGSLFAGMKIPEIESKVAAIQGKMGGFTYYSFMIEPARLLKLSYILHRNNANILLMPTYQRLIKKSRLQKVSRFVDEGGFFPNSVILSIAAGQGGLRFERSSLQYGDAKLGVLQLPQTYRAAYVIDGQHRLYGYAGSPRADKDLIPVVAFINLPLQEQVKLFMQINENQQAVPKNLRNTLNADLLWDSDDYREQIRALKLHIAQRLGESKTSPLYGRIIVGENQRSAIRCVTIEAISIGLERGNFLGTFSKTEMKISGTLYRGNNDQTFPVVVDFLEQCFSYVKEGLKNQWELGGSDGGFVFINTGVESLIRIFGDIVDHLVAHEGVIPGELEPEDLASICEPYIDPIIQYLDALSPDEAVEFRQQYGSGGRTKYWRKLQIALNDAEPEFSPTGFAEYLKDQEKQFNTESFEMIRDLETFLNTDVYRRLYGKFGDKWFKMGVPIEVQKATNILAVDKNQERETDDEVGPWSCLLLSDYQRILGYKSELWQELYVKQYTRPGDEEKSGSWKERLTWLWRLNKIRNDVDHSYAITEDDYDFLKLITSWLVKGEIDNFL